jgi:hypothetical protein
MPNLDEDKEHAKEFLNRFMDVALFDLEFENGEILEAMIGYHERELADETDSELQEYEKSVIAILRDARERLSNI